MKVKKQRKPRGRKLDGRISLDMCSCFSFHCDPMTVSPRFAAKIDKRHREGKCGACGHNPCRCKSEL